MHAKSLTFKLLMKKANFICYKVYESLVLMWRHKLEVLHKNYSFRISFPLPSPAIPSNPPLPVGRAREQWVPVTNNTNAKSTDIDLAAELVGAGDRLLSRSSE